MRNIVIRGQRVARRSFYTMLCTCAALVMVLMSMPGKAHAQSSTPTPDTSSFVQYGTLANAGKAEVSTAVGIFAGVIIAIVVGLVGLGMLIKWLRRAPKAS